jgi:hypothetical protein
VRRLLLRAGCLAIAALPVGLGAHGTAQASTVVTGNPSPDTDRLCTAGRVPCSIQVSPTWVEGARQEVVVTGEPGVSLEIRAFRVVDIDATTPRLVALTPAVAVTTDTHGFGTSDLTVPTVGEDETGGPVLVAPADSVGRPLASVLGTWTLLGSRRPMVLGDGFGTEKPVGEDLRLTLGAAAPGTAFDVELRRDGQWVSIGTDLHECTDVATPCVVTYQVPRGLRPTTYDVRLVSTTSGTPVAEWEATPSEEGEPVGRAAMQMPAVGTGLVGAIAGSGTNPVPRARAQSLDIPDIGSAVAGATDPARHSPELVRRVTTLLAVLALGGVVVGVLLGARRRPRPEGSARG